MRPKARAAPHPQPRMAGTLVYLQTGARRSHKTGRQDEAARRTAALRGALGTHMGTGWGRQHHSGLRSLLSNTFLYSHLFGAMEVQLHTYPPRKLNVYVHTLVSKSKIQSSDYCLPPSH